MPLLIETSSSLNDAQFASVRALLSALSRDSGRDPLSDQAVTLLRSADVRHALAIDGLRVVGYAQLDGESLEIATDSDAISVLLDAVAAPGVLVWSHGTHSPLADVFESRGYGRERELLQLRRDLGASVEAPNPPDGIRIAAFTVGRDEDDWLRVNAAAFAHHPEQGGWTRADLDAREGEDWFDPAGFLLAWRGGDLVGFHWTKVHPNGDGEVYVIAVDPSTQGSGLGAVLLQLGLAHLQQRGCREVLLYVDASNEGAVRLYERNGFRRHDVDVQWRVPR